MLRQILILVILHVVNGFAQPWMSPEFPSIDGEDRDVDRLLQPKATICRYCLCDYHTKTVTCASASLRLKTVVLPTWAETFHAHNVSAREFPHFTYQPALKVVRINFCSMETLHPLSFIPLPNLETIHLSDNLLETIPENLFLRLTQLRVLNLARNHIKNLDLLKFSFPVILEKLHLESNPIQLGLAADSNVKWPLTRQIFLSNTNIQSLNSSHIIFKDSSICPNEACRTLRLSDTLWSNLAVMDLSDNKQMLIDESALSKFSNLSSLNLANCHLPTGILSWIDSSNTRLRHLDLNGAQFTDQHIRDWKHCTPSLEWLDISAIGLKSLHIATRCSSLQWLYAERNQLTNVEILSHSLKGIHLRYNLIDTWPLQSGTEAIPYVRLESLHLGSNQLERLPERALHVLPQLETLDLSDNRLTTLSHHSMPTLELRLKHLNLSGNYMASFKSPILPSLAVLDLSANNLVELSDDFFIALPSLQKLKLGHNPQTLRVDWSKISEDKSAQLIELDLSHNLLHSIPPLQSFRHLRSLDLSGNQLVYVDGSRLPTCLSTLNVRENLIHYLGNFTETQFSCLKDLDLSLNPLSCDCSLAVLAPILEHQSNFDDKDQYYCFANTWQHPLKTYVQSADSCQVDQDRFIPLLMNFLVMLSIFVVIAGLGAFAMLKMCSSFSKRVMPFAYKLVQTDDIVDL